MKLVVLRDPVYVRRRRVALGLALLLLLGLGLGVVQAVGAIRSLTSGRQASGPAPAAAAGVTAQAAAYDVSRTRLVARDTVTGGITPKSLAAGPGGLVLAQNMMYRHTITAYGPDGALRATIPDTIDLARFGVTGSQGPVKGAPVEAAWTADGAKAYVSNYSMYGPGFEHNGYDDCTTATTVDRSYLYRLDAATLKVDQVIQVGAVPKVVAITPTSAPC